VGARSVAARPGAPLRAVQPRPTLRLGRRQRASLRGHRRRPCCEAPGRLEDAPAMREGRAHRRRVPPRTTTRLPRKGRRGPSSGRSMRGPFWDAVEGRAPLPPAAASPCLELLEPDAGNGTIEFAFEATEGVHDNGAERHEFDDLRRATSSPADSVRRSKQKACWTGTSVRGRRSYDCAHSRSPPAEPQAAARLEEGCRAVSGRRQLPVRRLRSTRR
jgi:hypothetical protein